MQHKIFGLALQATPKTLWSFVKVVSEDGIAGWGEFTINRPRAELSRVFQQVLNEVTNADLQPDGPRRGPDLMDERVRSAIYTALDQAVFDIDGQRQNKKLVDLLNPVGNSATIPLYANINRSVIDRRPETFARRATQAKAAGFVAFKMAPFDDLSAEICQTDKGRALLHAGAERILAVRAAIGPELALMVDCHWRMDEKTAHECLGFLSEAGVSWYECPLPETTDTVDALRRLRSAANDRGMRLTGCETFTGWQAFAPFVENSVYDVIMPDVKYAGSLREIMAVGERAKAYGVDLSLHNPSGPVSHAVSLHVAAALDNGMPLEFQFNETPLFDQIVSGTLPPRVGSSILPDAPGIGIGLLEAGLAPL